MDLGSCPGCRACILDRDKVRSEVVRRCPDIDPGRVTRVEAPDVGRLRKQQSAIAGEYGAALRQEGKDGGGQNVNARELPAPGAPTPGHSGDGRHGSARVNANGISHCVASGCSEHKRRVRTRANVMAYHAAEVDRVEDIRINYEERRLVLQESAHPPEPTTGAEGFGLFYGEHHLQAVASGTAHPCGQVVSQMARVEDDLAHSSLGERFKVIVEQRPISDWDQGLRQVGGQWTEACAVSGRQ